MSFREILSYKIGEVSVEQILISIALLIICLIISKVLLRVLEKTFKRTSLSKGLYAFIRSLAKIILYFVTILIVADSLGIPVTSLLAVFSVVGLAVSLSLQSSIGNVMSGMMLLISKPFKTDDYIKSGGVEGRISEIGLLHTKLKTLDNTVIYIPNNELSGAKIVNFTEESLRRVDVFVEASYESPVTDVKQAINCAIDGIESILDEPESSVHIQNYKESSIEYSVRVWTRNEDYWDTYYALLENIKTEFDSHGVEMSYPHMNVHILDSGK